MCKIKSNWSFGSDSVEIESKQYQTGCIQSGLQVLRIIHFGFPIRSGLSPEKSELDQIISDIYKSNFKEELYLRFLCIYLFKGFYVSYL